MFRFENPIYLWLLLIIPILIIMKIMMWYVQRKKLSRIGNPTLLKELMPDVSRFRPWVKFLLLITALSSLILALARPQFGSKISHEKRNGIEAIIALDISNSMLAQDVQPSRLDKSKLMIENLINSFINDKIGLVVFAGEAYVQLPITSDYVSAKMFLSDITPNLISAQGTDIARAIRVSLSSFTQQKGVGKAIILITDGEDNEGGALEAVKEAKEKGVNVFILGVGDSKGAPIPLGNGEYLKDNHGQTVMTALNENMCKEIAQAGSGTYIHIDNTSLAQEQLNNELSKLQKGDSDAVVYSEYNEQFQIVALFSFILLLIEVCLLERKNPLFKRFNLFKR
ncbi:vWA domain-containing protein [Hoylesella nanceiensis]|uniref:vWA domain-containing protein n=1 Tax=Hoylesella nanceiensis TaxID=425941 RepID=UPI001CB135FE|nr:VWA domain-containing protein [Hoylesella nanceiensis]MBF1429442.1 VWA domain-containing protein [Hoylesella nanceiensis]MBF1441391.1 VWA domain-containing protein [Hoylesella nanceiensis]